MFVDIAEKKWENCVRGFMKKLLGILVLGLLWCNVADAKILKFNCQDSAPDGSWDHKRLEWVKFTIDTDKSELTHEWKLIRENKSKKFS